MIWASRLDPLEVNMVHPWPWFVDWCPIEKSHGQRGVQQKMFNLHQKTQ